jgi:nickel/cobalt transporter (NiCoT) family protein
MQASMLATLKRVSSQKSPDLRGRLIAIYGALAALNLGAWAWAFLAFHDRPMLLGIALVTYGLGLRHAVDADHIAAIDNVTRKLMEEKQHPVGVGFFFALGHSAIVVIIAIVVACAASMMGRFQSVHDIGGAISTGVSALFLLAIAAMNVFIFASVYRAYRRVRAGGIYVAEDLDILLNNRGLLARLFRPLFRLVSKSWHMFPLGFLFGLGFDTATEVAMFGATAAEATKGASLITILVFPALFAAGMSLIDTTDGVMMLGAYNWAFLKPVRKLYYNMTITLISVVVALFIGGVEAAGLIADKLGISGGGIALIGSLSANFNNLGFVIIAIFVVAWAASYVIYRSRRWLTPRVAGQQT